ncbi:uncharacterized protein LOC131145456 isoform X2 [Malania oleifera]|uniref:uncharacterized protein LOC131145456 isoform X2 n=1 Tax=Malania oleifera TaxID=397392 RepID=UPI0025AE5EE8|nr:uncharacterized protein LOC131145456 isoform X2 [Malania oleifera]
MGFLSGLCACLERRVKGCRGADGGSGGEADEGESSSLFFDLWTLQIATNFFSELNLLGHGRFGPVYKRTANHNQHSRGQQSTNLQQTLPPSPRQPTIMALQRISAGAVEFIICFRRSKKDS